MTIDVDKLFEEYFKKFIAENIGKYTEDELESKVADIYAEFGNAKIDNQLSKAINILNNNG